MKLINHVALVIDDSPSMAHLLHKTRQVVNDQIKAFQATSKLKNQETRLSVYRFGGRLECIAFDVNPSDVPDASTFLFADVGATHLVAAVYDVIGQMQRIPTNHGDHSFLIYVPTDGEDNQHHADVEGLRRRIDGLNEDWTIAGMVPNARAKLNARSFGLPAGNIEIWDTSSEQGMEEVGNTICDTYTSYVSMRSMGQKSTKSLFSFKDNLDKKDVAGKLEVVSAGEYHTYPVRPAQHDMAIKDFVEYWTKEPYRVGSAYYQLSKPEIVQAHKEVAVIEKRTGKMYSGSKARPALGLPRYDVKVAPADFDKFDVFIQSKSPNRKLVKDTSLIVFK